MFDVVIFCRRSASSEPDADEPMFRFVIREFFGTCYSVNLLYSITEQFWTVFVPASEVKFRFVDERSLFALTACVVKATVEFNRIKRLHHCKLHLHAVDPVIQLSHWLLDHISLRIKEFVIAAARFNEKSFLRTLSLFLAGAKSRAATCMQALVRGGVIRLKLRRERDKLAHLNNSRRLATERIREYRFKQTSLVIGESLTDYFQVDSSSSITHTSGLLGGTDLFGNAYHHDGHNNSPFYQHYERRPSAAVSEEETSIQPRLHRASVATTSLVIGMVESSDHNGSSISSLNESTSGGKNEIARDGNAVVNELGFVKSIETTAVI
jgi:hypothetical protein